MPVDKIDNSIKYHILSDLQIKKEIEKINMEFTKFFNLYYKEIEGIYRINNIIMSLRVLEDIVIHVDKRIEHYNIFHNIEKSNEYRIISFYCYWIIKLHPFIIDYEKIGVEKNIHYDLECINETFALYLYEITIKELHRKRGEYIELDNKYIHELKYTLRYRDLNKSNLLLLFEPKFKFSDAKK